MNVVETIAETLADNWDSEYGDVFYVQPIPDRRESSILIHLHGQGTALVSVEWFE